MEILSIDYELWKQIENKKYFALDGIRTRNWPDQRQVNYPLHYKYMYRLVITDLTFHLNYSKITLFL